MLLRKSCHEKQARRFAFLLPIALFLFALTSACAEEANLRVVASFSVLSELAHAVGSPRVMVTTLVPGGADAHTFDPTPADMAAVQSADLLLVNGLGFEPWADRLHAAAASRGGNAVRRVEVTSGILVLKVRESGVAMPVPDPHQWHNPRNMIVATQNIRDAFTTSDPAGRDQYWKQAADLTKRLEALDRELQELVSKLPVERRKLVTGHDSLGYFAAQYGFQVVDSALGSVTTETADPSAEHIARVVDGIRAARVPHRRHCPSSLDYLGPDPRPLSEPLGRGG